MAITRTGKQYDLTNGGILHKLLLAAVRMTRNLTGIRLGRGEKRETRAYSRTALCIAAVLDLDLGGAWLSLRYPGRLPRKDVPMTGEGTA